MEIHQAKGKLVLNYSDKDLDQSLKNKGIKSTKKLSTKRGKADLRYEEDSDIGEETLYAHPPL